MQEYKDGSFGDIQEGAELLKKLAEDSDELDKTKAVHFGTRESLLQKKLDLENRLEEKRFSNSQTDRLIKKMEQIERKVNRIIFALNAQHANEILVVD